MPQEWPKEIEKIPKKKERKKERKKITWLLSLFLAYKFRNRHREVKKYVQVHRASK